jgi:hypothetical protein
MDVEEDARETDHVKAKDEDVREADRVLERTVQEVVDVEMARYLALSTSMGDIWTC